MYIFGSWVNVWFKSFWSSGNGNLFPEGFHFLPYMFSSIFPKCARVVWNQFAVPGIVTQQSCFRWATLPRVLPHSWCFQHVWLNPAPHFEPVQHWSRNNLTSLPFEKTKPDCLFTTNANRVSFLITGCERGVYICFGHTFLMVSFNSPSISFPPSIPSLGSPKAHLPSCSDKNPPVLLLSSRHDSHHFPSSPLQLSFFPLLRVKLSHPSARSTSCNRTLWHQILLHLTPFIDRANRFTWCCCDSCCTLMRVPLY